MFKTTEEHYQYLSDKLANDANDSLLIFSVGLYAGILADGRDTTTWGDYYHLHTKDFLEKCRVRSVRIAISPPEYKSCRGQIQCKKCEYNYLRQLIKLINHQEYFDEFEWKLATKTHLSLICIGNECISGRNLNDSNWNSVSIKITGEYAAGLIQHTEMVYNDLPYLNESTILEYAKSQHISEEAFNVG